MSELTVLVRGHSVLSCAVHMEITWRPNCPGLVLRVRSQTSGHGNGILLGFCWLSLADL